MIPVTSYYRSDTGQKRDHNEDAVGAFEPKDAQQLKQSGRLYIVADGLGGHEMGEKASQFALDTLLKAYYQSPEVPPEQRLRDIIQQINLGLINFSEKNFEKGEKIATTIVAAVLLNDKLLVANVGDSRAYLLREGEVAQITRDHSFVGEMVRAGAITEVEAQKSRLKNRLTRSLGSDRKLEVEVYEPIPLRPGDTILLCTDGLTQYATGEELLKANFGTPKDIVERLIDYANKRGGSDNITVSVIQYGKPSTIPAGKALRIGALAGGAVITLGILAVLGLSLLTGKPFALIKGTATPTASATATITPTSTATVIATPTITPTHTTSATVTPAIADCEYTVISGDSLSEIAFKFLTSQDTIFRPGENQPVTGIIYAGETLIIRGITTDICVNGGGSPIPSVVIPPASDTSLPTVTETTTATETP